MCQLCYCTTRCHATSECEHDGNGGPSCGCDAHNSTLTRMPASGQFRRIEAVGGESASPPIASKFVRCRTEQGSPSVLAAAPLRVSSPPALEARAVGRAYPAQGHDFGPGAAAIQDTTELPRDGALEIWPISVRQWHHFVMQEISVVLGADVLLPFAVDAPESLLRIPRRREHARILNMDRDVDRLAAVG